MKWFQKNGNGLEPFWCPKPYLPNFSFSTHAVCFAVGRDSAMSESCFANSASAPGRVMLLDLVDESPISISRIVKDMRIIPRNVHGWDTTFLAKNRIKTSSDAQNLSQCHHRCIGGTVANTLALDMYLFPGRKLNIYYIYNYTNIYIYTYTYILGYISNYHQNGPFKAGENPFLSIFHLVLLAAEMRASCVPSWSTAAVKVVLCEAVLLMLLATFCSLASVLTGCGPEK